MPDTIVPIVRRPVRRTSTATQETKVESVANATRKLSIGGDTNSRVSPEIATPRLRRTWTPSAPKEKVEPAKTEKKEVKKLKDDEGLPPPAIPPSYSVPSSSNSSSGFPAADKKNLPRLTVAKDRVQKSQVSSCVFNRIHSGIEQS